MLTHARSRSLTNLFECWNEIEKYKYWNKDCSQTHTEYLREILLDSRGSNVSVQEMMQSLWWWPWWWNRHKQYTKQTYQVQSWWIFLCIAAVKKKKKKKKFLSPVCSFLLWRQNALLHILCCISDARDMTKETFYAVLDRSKKYGCTIFNLI